MTRCIHDHPAHEAYAVDARTGEATPIEIRLCDWPDQHPERLVDAPRWLLRTVGAGLAIRPEHDCVGCPARKDAP